jgi:hypothetical protein
MATDYQSLMDSAAEYVGTGNVSESQALKLGLLKASVLALVPAQDTSVAALTSIAEVAGYGSVSNASLGDLLELALLNLLANNL